MGRVLHRLERLDRDLQARPAHRLMGTGSLHASIIEGGREWSSYPDRCALRLERRTIVGETGETFMRGDRGAAGRVARGGSGVRGVSRTDLRAPFIRDPGRPSAARRRSARAAAANGVSARPVGMSFWTDAAILGSAGIPCRPLRARAAPGCTAPKSTSRSADVIACRDTLAALAHESECGAQPQTAEADAVATHSSGATRRWRAIEQVASRVTLVAPPGSLAADLPARACRARRTCSACSRDCPRSAEPNRGREARRTAGRAGPSRAPRRVFVAVCSCVHAPRWP